MNIQILFTHRNNFAVTILNIIVFGAVFYLWLSGCKREDAQKVSLTPRNTASQKTSTNPAKEKIKIAISAMISPEKTFTSYEELLDFIGEQLGQTVEMVQRQTYAEVNYLIKENKVSAAIVCSGAYVEGHRDFGMELLVAPMCHDQTEYYSYIIVNKDSPINSFAELRKKVFAFTDPMSNSGRLAPTYLLAQMGETPDTFFREHIFTYSHDNSIKSVAEKIVDGAAVDSLIWEYENESNPVFTSKTKVIHKSTPFGIPPIVVPVQIEPALKQKLKDILLNIHHDKKGREILNHLQIDKFVEVDDHQYDSVRQMDDFMNKFKRGEKK